MNERSSRRRCSLGVCNTRNRYNNNSMIQSRADPSNNNGRKTGEKRDTVAVAAAAVCRYEKHMLI